MCTPPSFPVPLSFVLRVSPPSVLPRFLHTPGLHGWFCLTGHERRQSCCPGDLPWHLPGESETHPARMPVLSMTAVPGCPAADPLSHKQGHAFAHSPMEAWFPLTEPFLCFNLNYWTAVASIKIIGGNDRNYVLELKKYLPC